MGDFLNQITVFLEQIVYAIGYPGIWLVMFLENIFTPIPTEPFLPLAGFLAAEGDMTFIGVWLAATTGAVTGSFVIYLVGRIGGEPVVRGIVDRFGRIVDISQAELDRGLTFFNKWGAAAVFFGRFIPVVRPAVSLISGISRLNPTTFLIFTALSSSLANLFWISVGYFLGENWSQILATANASPVLVIGVVVIGLVAAFFGLRFIRSKVLAAPRVAPAPQKPTPVRE
jgi:membrane protein DedA with SNARE-associated domain